MDINFSSYPTIGESIGKLVEEKQAAYGDSFSKAPRIMAILYPNGINPDMMDSALTVIRVIDKLNRIATNKVDLMGESPWGDIAGYSLLELMKQNKLREVEKAKEEDIPF